MNGEASTMVQVTDVSASIMYDMEKADNKFLSLINACVSHELRNPLNSLIAQNIEKTQLYETLQKKVDSMPEPVREELRPILTRLKAGKKVQESSANLMRFLVQDCLDYA